MNNINLKEEVWVQITDQIVPGIKPYYYISNMGRVYSNSDRGGFMNPSTSSNGYKIIKLRAFTGKNGNITKHVHRLVLTAFSYIPGCENLEVNHKDGNKSNNCLYNLEWVTRKENVIHSFDIGLRGYGEDASRATITYEEAKEICELYVKGYKINQIASYKRFPRHIVSNIIYGNSWIELQKEFEGLLGSKIPHRKLSDEQTHMICKYLQDNKNSNKERSEKFKEILEMLGMEYNKNNISLLSMIYYHKTYTDISEEYDF